MELNRVSLFLLSLIVFVLFFAGRASSQSVATKEVKHELLLEVSWGDGSGEFGGSSDYWDPGVQYFYAVDEDVIVFDSKKKEILLFRGGVFERSFNVPQSPLPVGLLLTDDIVYYFLKTGGAAFSVVDGKYLYYTESPFLFNQDDKFYLYGETIVASQDSALFCFTKELKRTGCPKFSGPAPTGNNDLTYFANGDYAIINHLPTKKATLYDAVGNMKGGVDGFNDPNLLFEVPGADYLKPEGVYYIVHTTKTCQIWFAPWK